MYPDQVPIKMSSIKHRGNTVEKYLLHFSRNKKNKNGKSNFLLSSYFIYKYYCRMYKNSYSRLDGLKLQPDFKNNQVKNNTTRNFKMWDQNRWKILPSALLLIPRITRYFHVRATKSKKMELQVP